VRGILDQSPWSADDQLLHTFARIFYGAVSSAGASVTESDDQDAAALRVETAIGFLLSGFRGLVEAGQDQQQDQQQD